MAKHYDVIALGRGIGVLSAAVLLARRSWRVLVLGNGRLPCFYHYDGLPLARRSFTMLCAHSPAFSRILVELAQSQTFRRRFVPVDPMFQAMLPNRRFEVPPDTQLFAKEIEREFPEVRRVVDDLYTSLATINASADSALDGDVTWPPTGFWERRESHRVLSSLPRVKKPWDPLADFPHDHELREIVGTTANAATDKHGVLPGFAIARLHGAWTRGVVRLPRGEDELVEFFLDRIRAHGGEVKLNDRAQTIVATGGRVRGVLVDGDEEPTAAQFVVSDTEGRTLLELTEGFEPSRRALSAMPATIEREGRFVTSIVVREAGLPPPLGDEVFLFGPTPLHMQCLRHPDLKPSERLLVCESMVEDSRDIASERTRAFELVKQYLPFIERHVKVVDSPHDGLPVWDFRSGSLTQVDRVKTRPGGGTLEAEPMVRKYEIDPDSLFGLGGEPCRTVLPGAFVAGKTTMPTLGQEGELLGAWSAARIITKTDRTKERMRRELWSKIEI